MFPPGVFIVIDTISCSCPAELPRQGDIYWRRSAGYFAEYGELAVLIRVCGIPGMYPHVCWLTYDFDIYWDNVSDSSACMLADALRNAQM